ncbi:MAG: carboxypeptidase-like regulatory domain-containing protein [Nitrosopumilaceae archaeon]
MLKNHLKVTLFLFAVSLLSLSYTQAEAILPSLQVTVTSEKQTYQTNEYPKLVGSVIDESGNPVPNASVQITAAKYGVWTSTNLEGKFVFDQKVSPDVGVNIFNVMVKKKGYPDGITSTSFIVIGASPQKTQSQPVQPNKVQDQTTMIKILEQAKQFQERISAQEKKRQQLQAQQQLIQQQREVAYSNLLTDLTKMDLETLPNTPRNAFAAFLTTVDEGVHAIYWSQFELTEKISQEAHQAKLQALQSGMSSPDAMKVFQKKAAISRDQLIEHNKNIQIQYGHADKNVQDKFDKRGKLPRTED